MDYMDLVDIYNDNKLSVLYVTLYTMSIGIMTVLAFYHYLRQVDEDGNKMIKDGVTFDNFKNLIMRMLGALIIVALFPVAISFIQEGIKEVIDAVPEAWTSQTVDKPIEDYIAKKKEENRTKIDLLGLELDVVTNTWTEKNRIFEAGVIETVALISKYLYGFALGGYFMWLLVVECFVPVAAVGFFFKEMRSFTESIIRHFLAANLVPIFLYIANKVSISAYDLYTNETVTGSVMTTLMPEISYLVVGVVLLLFRAYLYKKSFDFAMKVL